MSTTSDNPTTQPDKRSSRGMISFVVVAALLLLAGLSLNVTVQAMQLNFKKQPVDILVYGKPLEQLPKSFGPWHMVAAGDQRLNEDVEHALGTSEYVFRVYLDERVLGKAVIESLKTMDAQAQARAIWQYQNQTPAAVVHFAMTYYTGLLDTVAHVPDRCYVADGYEPVNPREVTWKTPIGPLDLRYITFEDQSGAGKVSRNVAYFFQVNGKYKADPLAVRVELQNLLQRYGYYSKVELMTQRLDTAQAEKVMEDFLNYAMPEAEKCLPDWQRVLADAGKGGGAK